MQRSRGVRTVCKDTGADLPAQHLLQCVGVLPPAGKSQISVLKNRVIGYYEAWMARKSCHRIDPTNLPLDALTHVNFAFASIDASSYQVVAMDSATPSSLFKDTTNIKSIKQDISVFTQSLFEEIAGDATKRQTFAKNVVQFMRQYGFDGVDLDWEYPGAGDRGGKPEDTENYALLLETLRQTFDSSGSTFGLTFTAPSSYWYLRWFDLPKMIKYVDWINVMTYDLHGVWDASNPISSIVQGHTNLTEIKTAVELFWRVDVPPGMLVLGFGFYGRSFTLADLSCTTPGCPFSGASDAGPCSDTGGMLAYYEIMSMLQGTSASPKRATISPTHDKKAAVNYFTFNDNQWVSYDDHITFRQKVNWANDVGLGGAMIWASDLDDDRYSAHSGLLGRSIISTATLQEINKAESNPKSVITDLAGFNGQKCFRHSGKCVNLNDDAAMANACGSGNTVVGWDDAGCGRKSCHCGKPICCPSNAAPKNCKWRGQKTGQGGARSDCSGQCEAGEMNINGIRSSWGGGFTNDGDTNKCGRGYKAFCCPDPDYRQVTRGCSYAACGKNCPSGKTALLTKFDDCWAKDKSTAARTRPSSLAATEWGVDLATMCDSSHSCEWGRSRAACCSVKKAPTRKAMCTIDLCDKDSEYCGASASDFWKRSFEEGEEHSLQKRKVGKKFAKATIDGLIIKYVIAGYPTIGELFSIKGAAQVLMRAFRTRHGYCAGSTLDVTDFKSKPSKEEYARLNTEHPLDKSLIGKWMEAAGNGVLPTSRRPLLKPIDLAFWQKVWNEANTELGKKPPVGRNQTLGKRPDTPSERIAEAFGSNHNPFPFLASEDAVNIAKGRIFEHKDPVQLPKISRLAKDAVKADTDAAVDELLSEFQTAFAALEYIRNSDFEIRYNDVIQQVYLQLGYIEETTRTHNLQN
ncbi:glycoside hydrolase family 18 protein [Aspergillus aculeatinus CBS 121060]|uniref:Uncharacterized protein n=1 Tax=Aspergillus aculeatinus CBS 121060 TaxID=1448322 RepID=A0ACD1HGK6_9EURO|nr:hypothetical protein BO66DRAFT_436203 [Aspergillus aculeatinus CBS 121060]RAH72534.1 hypothetical protein BO66DRAFT_436203 [Aspergillus aculeatinus CBS 121060]